jgi:hypothetical protein
MLNTSFKGEIAQLKVMLRATEKNYMVSRPNTDCHYDLVIDTGKLTRVQIKYCNRKSHGRESQLELRLDNTESNRKYYDRKDIDIILVYVPKIEKILMFESKRFHRKKTIHINLANKNSKHYYEKFIW